MNILWCKVDGFSNYSDIQVLMMVTETETLMSTFFSATFILSDFNPYLLSYIYIYIYIYIVIHRQTVSFYQNSSVWLDT